MWPWNAITCVALLGGYYAMFPTACWPPRQQPVAGCRAGHGSGVGGLGRERGASLASAIVFGFLWTRAGDRIAVAAFTTALVAVLLAAVASRGIGGAVAS